MDGWLKGLVAVTCAAVLAAVAWWGWSEWTAAKEQAALDQAAQWAREDAQCQAQLEAWGAGDRADLIRRYGDAASAERHLVECVKAPILRLIGE